MFVKTLNPSWRGKAFSVLQRPSFRPAAWNWGHNKVTLQQYAPSKAVCGSTGDMHMYKEILGVDCSKQVIAGSWQWLVCASPPKGAGCCGTNWSVHAKKPQARLKDDMSLLHTTYHCQIICPCRWQAADHSYPETLELALSNWTGCSGNNTGQWRVCVCVCLKWCQGFPLTRFWSNITKKTPHGQGGKPTTGQMWVNVFKVVGEFDQPHMPQRQVKIWTGESKTESIQLSNTTDLLVATTHLFCR